MYSLLDLRKLFGIDGCNQKRASLCCTTVLLRLWWYVRLRLHRYFWAYTASFAEHAARTTIETIGLDRGTVWSWWCRRWASKQKARLLLTTSSDLCQNVVRVHLEGDSFLHMLWNLTWVHKHRNHLESLPSCTSGAKNAHQPRSPWDHAPSLAVSVAYTNHTQHHPATSRFNPRNMYTR